MNLFSLADTPPTIEYMSAHDWEDHFFDDINIKERKRARSRNPMSSYNNDDGPSVIWGFLNEGMVPFLININYLTSAFRATHSLVERKQLQEKFFGLWFPSVSTTVDGETSFVDLVENVFSQPAMEQFDKNFKLKRWIVDTYDGNWIKFDKMSFYFLTIKKEEKEIEKVTDKGIHYADQMFIKNLYDASILRDRVKSCIPWKAISDHCQRSPEIFGDVYCGPRRFDPKKNVPNNYFLWPWQRSIARMDASDKKVMAQAIPTTSVVGDLRHSTAAMGLFSPPEKYAAMLDEITNECKRLSLQFGAYFDKETGDGFAAHFCRSFFDDEELGENAVCSEIENAILLSAEIILSANRICKKYARSLKHGVENLQMSVGIHSEDAVWLCDRAQIKAIGPSVVWAARLCASSGPKEILISNYAYEALAKNGYSQRIAEFGKKKVVFKEYGENLGVYGYAMRPL